MVRVVNNIETLLEFLDSEQEVPEENSFLEDEVPILSESEWRQEREKIRELELRGFLPSEYVFI